VTQAEKDYGLCVAALNESRGQIQTMAVRIAELEADLAAARQERDEWENTARMQSEMGRERVARLEQERDGLLRFLGLRTFDGEYERWLAGERAVAHLRHLAGEPRKLETGGRLETHRAGCPCARCAGERA
jgi:hypothetical protein